MPPVKINTIEGVLPEMVPVFDQFISDAVSALTAGSPVAQPEKYALLQLKTFGEVSRKDNGRICSRDYACVDERLRPLFRNLVIANEHVLEQRHHHAFIRSGGDGAVICSHDSSEKALDNQARFYVSARLEEMQKAEFVRAT